MTPERWQLIEELYHEARARPPNERAASLVLACRGDEALRREVESLLKEPVSGDGLLAQPPLRPPAQSTAERAPMTGRVLGGYRLEALLGAGGMGEVYRARDSKLGRQVAIKILPHAFTSDPDRLARFDREARTLATLNHPNICAIHGVEEADSIRFLILEFVKGETLAQRLHVRGKGLPLAEALAIARQIADALEVAHEKGIAHRDLKPANINITPDGAVKVLDFGLAKATSPADDAPHGAAVVDTRDGAVIGTAAYMSPEQARGLPVDKRTDIWAFGCVLYEMLTGRVAFAGHTASDSIAKILEREPDWSALPAATPVAIRRLLHRALAKDPKTRLRDIGDARIEIDAGDDAQPISAQTRDALRAAARARWLAAAAVVVLAVGLTAMLTWNLRPVPVASVTRFPPYLLPSGEILNGSRGAHIVMMSPDGTKFVYSGRTGLYLRSMDSIEPKVIAGTENIEATGPVFSPDGSSIVFFTFSDGTLKRIAVNGGVAQTICPAQTPTGISWGPRGIAFGQGSEGIKLVDPDTGGSTLIVRAKDNESTHGPQILPGGKHVLFTVAVGDALSRWDQARIVVQPLDTTAQEPKTIIEPGSDARYLPRTGHIVYALSGSLYAVGFDVGTLQAVGERVPMIQGVRRAAGSFTGAAAFGVSDTGTLAYVPGPVENPYSAPRDLALMDRKGVITELKIQPPGLYAYPSVSPDGTRVAFNSEDGKELAAIYTYRLAGGEVIQRRTFDGNNRFAVWKDDTHLAFQSDRGGAKAVWWQSLDGGPAEPLTTPDPGTSDAPESWTGDTLLYSKTRVDSVTRVADVSLWTLSLNDRTPRRFDAPSSSGPIEAVYSRDGQRLAYTITEGRQMTIWVQEVSTGARQRLTAQASDTPKHPRWSPDGTEICYDPNVSGFECVQMVPGRFGSFRTPVPIPKKLVQGPPSSRTNYDVMADGRFVGVLIPGRKDFLSLSVNQIDIVLNWFEELKTRVPIR